MSNLDRDKADHLESFSKAFNGNDADDQENKSSSHGAISLGCPIASGLQRNGDVERQERQQDTGVGYALQTEEKSQ